jgi:uncharacterized protein DUF3570
VLAAAAVAATDTDPHAAAGRRGHAGALLTAALALPGIGPAGAFAQTVADHGVVELKILDYRDWQPGANRMTVHSPSIYALMPIGDTLEVEASIVYDSMSGASPLYFDTLSGASQLGVTDYRTAGDVKVTKYFNGWALGVGGVVSSERDYLSRGASIDVRVFSDDRNRTWAFGFAGANDRIDPVNDIVTNASRNTVEFLVGITQALSADSIVQSNLTYSHGHGYFSDPYKTADRRPAERDIFAWLTRYNRYYAAPDAALRLSYRYLHDSFGSVSNTFNVAWVQALPAGWSITPSLRYYTQSAADFYYGPPPGKGFVPGQPYTADTRLSAFGAFTMGLGMAKALGDGWSVDLKLDFYRQQSNWRPGGGSPGILPFSARWLLAGISKTF